jgi:hypothetical protein
VERAIRLVENHHSKTLAQTVKGFGSSNCGVCITELVDGMINVMHAEEYARPDFNAMINTTVRSKVVVEYSKM